MPHAAMPRLPRALPLLLCLSAAPDVAALTDVRCAEGYGFPTTRAARLHGARPTRSAPVPIPIVSGRSAPVPMGPPRRPARVDAAPCEFAPPYDCGEWLGSGSFGTVCRIADSENRSLAMKRITAHRRAEEEFLNELQVHGRLAGGAFANTALVEAFAWDTSSMGAGGSGGAAGPNVSFALVMPLYSGGDLRGVDVRQGLVDVKETMAQLALGLRELHRRGIIHRDFKAANCAARDRDQSRWHIIDYGLAKVCHDSERPCLGQATAGTPRYMPCTVARRMRYGYEVDWYSWGMTLLYLLFGDAFNPAVTSKPGALLKIPAEEICMASRRKFVWWTAGRREQRLARRLREASHVPVEVKRLLLRLLGRSFEDVLSEDQARLTMENGSVESHPVLGHPAWLLSSWTTQQALARPAGGPRLFAMFRHSMRARVHQEKLDAGSTIDGQLGSYWKDICDRFAESGSDCEAVIAAGGFAERSPATTRDLCRSGEEPGHR